MSASKEHIQRKYTDILKEYIRLNNIKSDNNVAKYSDGYVLELLSIKFYLETDTIEKILYREMRKEAERERQTKLDL